MMEEVENIHWNLLVDNVRAYGYASTVQLLGRLLVRLGERQESFEEQKELDNSADSQKVLTTRLLNRSSGVILTPNSESPESEPSTPVLNKKKKSPQEARLALYESTQGRRTSFSDTPEIFTDKSPKKSSTIQPHKPPLVPILKNSPPVSFSKKREQIISPTAQDKWRRAVNSNTQDGPPDPWENRPFDFLMTERARAYHYDATTKQWSEEDILVKIEEGSFAEGGMRLCFAMRQMPATATQHHQSWKTSPNYVAKRYIHDASREAYFKDVKLQMVAKLYCDKFNKMNPPKKIDVIQSYVIELQERDDSPVYSVEHYVEGEYVKYNGNAGFVETDMNIRNTPQAFSHFTFERSDFHEIVVDVQGVGDLYTDPQIHSMDEEDYGEGNLGCRGIALFFSTHICSPLCIQLGLTPFPLCRRELSRILETREGSEANSPSVRGGGGGAGGGPGSVATSPEHTVLRLSPVSRSPNSTGSTGFKVPSAAASPPPGSRIGARKGSISQQLPVKEDAAQEWEGECVAAEAQAGAEADIEVLLNSLIRDPPCGSPTVPACMHYHIAYLYADAQRKGRRMYGRWMGDAAAGMYHLRRASLGGVEVASLQLWRMHGGMRLNSPVMAALLTAASPLFAKLHLQDQRLATAYLTHAARSGNAAACAKLGQKYQTGDGVDANLKDAHQWYERTLKYMSPEWIESQKGNRTYAMLSEFESVEEEAPDLPPEYQILAWIGECLAAGWKGLKKNDILAANRLDEAARKAAASGREKLSQKWKDAAKKLREDY